MAGTPCVPQGLINRLKGSLIIPNFPSLNATAAFMGKQALSASFKGPAVTRMPTMTGAVNSPEPYREVAITVHLVKSMALAAAWKAKEEADAILGPITFRADASNLPPYLFDNCSLDGVQGLTSSGTDPDYVIVIGGFYNINANLWS